MKPSTTSKTGKSEKSGNSSLMSKDNQDKPQSSGKVKHLYLNPSPPQKVPHVPFLDWQEGDQGGLFEEKKDPKNPVFDPKIKIKKEKFDDYEEAFGSSQSSTSHPSRSDTDGVKTRSSTRNPNSQKDLSLSAQANPGQVRDGAAPGSIAAKDSSTPSPNQEVSHEAGKESYQVAKGGQRVRSPSPSIREPPKHCSTPLRNSAPASPRRSPRLQKSPGKSLVEDKLSTFKGLTKQKRKKGKKGKRSTSSIREEAEVDPEAPTEDEASGVTPVPHSGFDHLREHDLSTMFREGDNAGSGDFGEGFSGGFRGLNESAAERIADGSNPYHMGCEGSFGASAAAQAKAADQLAFGAIAPSSDYFDPNTNQILKVPANYVGNQGSNAGSWTAQDKLIGAFPETGHHDSGIGNATNNASQMSHSQGGAEFRPSEVGGPTGFESPVSSTLTEIISPTVKGPFVKGAEEEEEESEEALIRAAERAVGISAGLTAGSVLHTPPRQPDALEEADAEMAGEGEGEVDDGAVVLNASKSMEVETDPPHPSSPAGPPSQSGATPQVVASAIQQTVNTKSIVVVQDPTTGSNQVITQNVQNSSFQQFTAGHEKQAGFQQESNLQQTQQEILAPVHPNFDTTQVPKAQVQQQPAAASRGSERSQELVFPTSSGHRQTTPGVLSIPPTSASEAPSAMEVEDASESAEPETDATDAAEDNGQGKKKRIPVIANKLIHFKPGQQPPPSRTPGNAEYDNRGDQQYQIDLAAVKAWKEGVKLGKAELVFKTKNHITHPTPETKEFFERTGMRKDLSMNHLMAAILNNEKVKAAEKKLWDKIKTGGQGYEKARKELLEVFIVNNINPKKQRELGLRTAKGKTRTPEEAEAHFINRTKQLKIAAARAEARTASAALAAVAVQPGAGGSQAKATSTSTKSSTKTSASASTSSGLGAIPKKKPDHRPEDSEDDFVDTRNEWKSQQERNRQKSQNRNKEGRDRRDQSRSNRGGLRQGPQQQSVVGPPTTNRGRDSYNRRSEVGNTPASDHLGRSRRPTRQDHDARRIIEERSRSRSSSQHQGGGRGGRGSGSSSYRGRGAGNGNGRGQGQSVRAAVDASATGGASASASVVFGGEGADHAQEEEEGMAEHNRDHTDETDPAHDDADANEAGARLGNQPGSAPVKLMVSGYANEGQGEDITQKEAPEIIKRICEIIDKAHKEEEDPIVIHDIEWVSGNKIGIIPANTELGERLAEKIRHGLRTNSHPRFQAEFNTSMDKVAELCIRAPKFMLGPLDKCVDLIEGDKGGIVHLNSGSAGGWPQGLKGKVAYLKAWDEKPQGQRIIKFTAHKEVVQAIQKPPNPGMAYIGRGIGTVQQGKGTGRAVVEGLEVHYRLQ